METFTEETQPLLKQIRQRHIVFKLFQVFLTVTVAILLIVVIQQSVSVNTVSTIVEPKLLQGSESIEIPSNLQIRTGENAGRGNDDEDEDDLLVENNPVVAISNGRVRGTTLKSRLGRTFSAFYNMPYAEPPTGQYRFSPPRPFREKWENVFDGTIRGSSQTECLQFKGEEVAGVEDCLKISVFSPQLPSAKNPKPNLPVMFYILGGAFIYGRSNRYGAEYIMDEDVVLVHVDFRVGAFGYLSTEDGEIRGNMAFKDQVLALKWVQENIEKFGGNRKKVLIFGNSSGAASVHAHMISKMSQGLFHRAISQSGSVLLRPGHRTRPLALAKSLGKLLQCPEVQNSSLLHQCLLEVDPKRIATYYATLPDSYFITKEAIPENGDTSEVFMEDMPGILSQQGKFNKDIPWMVGSNSAEAYPDALELLANGTGVKALNAFWDVEAPLLFNYRDDEDHNASRAFKNFYFHSQDISNSTRKELTDCYSDIKWVLPVVQSADLHAKFGGKVYFYWLTHEAIQSYGESRKQGFAPPYGVAHADEVQFLFPYDPYPVIDQKSVDFQFSTSMVKIWAEFARTGAPKVPSGEKWKPIDGRNPRESSWMELNDNRFQPVNPLKYRLQFLNSFPLLDPNYGYDDDSEH